MLHRTSLDDEWSIQRSHLKRDSQHRLPSIFRVAKCSRQLSRSTAIGANGSMPSRKSEFDGPSQCHLLTSRFLAHVFYRLSVVLPSSLGLASVSLLPSFDTDNILGYMKWK